MSRPFPEFLRGFAIPKPVGLEAATHGEGTGYKLVLPPKMTKWG
jgi:hypothetical protein